MTRTLPARSFAHRRARLLGPVGFLAAPVLATILACAPDRESPPQGGASPKGAHSLRLAIGGWLDGHLEPCGCAKAQLGGLARRVFHLQRFRDKYDLILEGGNLVHDATPLAELKLLTTLEVYRLAQPGAVALGPKDLELPLEQLVGYLGSFEYPFISSDLQTNDGFEWPIKSHVEHTIPERGTVRIGALTLGRPDQVADRLELLDPQTAWKAAMAGAAPSTLRVVMIHARADRIRDLADALTPRPDLVIGVSDSVPEPPSAPDQSPERGVPVVWTGTRGRSVTQAWLRRSASDPDEPVVTNYGVVQLTGSQTAKGAMEHRDAKAMIDQHRHMVAAMELREQMAEQREPAIEGATYVGSAACAGCHAEAYKAWQSTAHSKAWKTLVDAEGDAKRYGWPVTKYPDCIGCHTVGYGERSGFVNPKKTPLLLNVGCEECHGPSSKHIAAPDGKRAQFIIKSDAKKCLECHNQEQSPDFDYLKRWHEIQHK